MKKHSKPDYVYELQGYLKQYGFCINSSLIDIDNDLLPAILRMYMLFCHDIILPELILANSKYNYFLSIYYYINGDIESSIYYGDKYKEDLDDFVIPFNYYLKIDRLDLAIKYHLLSTKFSKSNEDYLLLRNFYNILNTTNRDILTNLLYLDASEDMVELEYRRLQTFDINLLSLHLNLLRSDYLSVKKYITQNKRYIPNRYIFYGYNIKPHIISEIYTKSTQDVICDMAIYSRFIISILCRFTPQDIIGSEIMKFLFFT